MMSIGSPKEEYKPLKIKDNVDLVGLSQLLPLPNHGNSSKPEPSEISLNKNSSHVTQLTVMPDVTVDGHILP